MAAQQNVGPAGIGLGNQPSLEAMERAAYERGVADERRRVESAIAQVRVAIEKFDDAPASACAHIEMASKALGDRLSWDRKPHPGWQSRNTGGYLFLRVGDYIAIVDPLKAKWLIAVYQGEDGDYTLHQRAGRTDVVDWSNAADEAKLEAEDALAKVLATALEELRRG